MPRFLSKASRTGLAVALLLGAVASEAAWAGINEVSVGLALPQPFGSAGDTLNRPVGVAAQAWLVTPDFLPNTIQFNLAFEYLPFQLVNVSGANSIQANLNMIGGYAGLTFWGEPSFLGFRPYISADLGFLYDFLVLPGASGAVGNSGTAFALRAAPGFDLPFFSHFGLLVEMPITVAYQKTTLTIWETTFSLRWRL